MQITRHLCDFSSNAKAHDADFHISESSKEVGVDKVDGIKLDCCEKHMPQLLVLTFRESDIATLRITRLRSRAEVAKSNGKNFECVEHGKVFQSSAGYYGHMRAHHT